MSFSEKLIISLIHIRDIPLIWAALSKIRDLIAPDQFFGCQEKRWYVYRRQSSFRYYTRYQLQDHDYFQQRLH